MVTPVPRYSVTVLNLTQVGPDKLDKQYNYAVIFVPTFVGEWCISMYLLECHGQSGKHGRGKGQGRVLLLVAEVSQ